MGKSMHINFICFFFAWAICTFSLNTRCQAFDLPPKLKTLTSLDKACQKIDKIPASFIMSLSSNPAIANWLNLQVDVNHTAWNQLLLNNIEIMQIIHMQHSDLFDALRHWASFDTCGENSSLYLINLYDLNSLCNTAPQTKRALINILNTSPSKDYFNLQILLNVESIILDVNTHGGLCSR